MNCNIGRWSFVIGWVSVFWGAFMVVVLCLPQSSPTNELSTLNYSGVALGAILVYAIITWFVSAKYWYKVTPLAVAEEDNGIVNNPMRKTELSEIKFNN